jgi:hypothetical protein
MILCSCQQVPPPTERSAILVTIQKVLFFLTLLYGVFLSFSHGQLALLYFVSCIMLFYAFTQLSYFSCMVLVLLHIINILWLVADLSVRFQNDQVNINLNWDVVHRMLNFVFCTNCIYFNFNGYKEYKAIALEVKEEGEIVASNPGDLSLGYPF